MNPFNILSILIPLMLRVSRLFSHGISNRVTCLGWSCPAAERRLKASTQTWLRTFFLFLFFVFLTLTATDCSLIALLGSVERIFPSDLQPPLVRTSPALCLKAKLLCWSSLTLSPSLSFFPTCTRISIVTHLHLPPSSVSHCRHSSSSPHGGSELLTHLQYLQ